jgi:hypothetical protein
MFFAIFLSNWNQAIYVRNYKLQPSTGMSAPRLKA